MMQIITVHYENAFPREGERGRARRNGRTSWLHCIADVIPSFETDLLRTVCAGCAASAADLTLAWPVIVRSVAHLGANHGSARNVSWFTIFDIHIYIYVYTTDHHILARRAFSHPLLAVAQCVGVLTSIDYSHNSRNAPPNGLLLSAARRG